MTKLEVEIHDDLMSIINKFKNLDDHGVELIIPAGAVIFDNVLNLKLLEKEAERLDKTIQFTTNDPNGMNLISELRAENMGEDFVATEMSENDVSQLSEELPEDEPIKRSKRRSKKSFVTVSGKNRGKAGKVAKILIILFLLLGGTAYAATQVLWTLPTADVKVIVNSQPLTKSVQIKVVKDGTTSASEKTLKGYSVDTVISNIESIETTGTETIGDKAEGKIKIFNKTTSEKEFKKGQTVRYEKDDNDYEYVLKDSVTVPERTEEDDGNGGISITPGEATVEVEAKDIGEQYNIDEGDEIRINDQDKDDFSARANEDFSGGSSETIAVVSEEDKTNLAQQLQDKGIEDIEKNLEQKAKAGRKYIKGSYDTQVTKEEFNHEVGDEADTLELTQEMLATGLEYSTGDLDKLLENLVQELIPSGYELSNQDKEINVEVLGNTDSTVSSPEEADLQVTIKAFVITIVEQEMLKEELVDKSLEDAQKLLGGIKNIQTYELEVTPNIPFLQRMPRNKDKITVTIQRK